MSRGKQTDEKPTCLGARVYKKHRKMLKALGRVFKTRHSEALRRAIEEAYGKHVTRVS